MEFSRHGRLYTISRGKNLFRTPGTVNAIKMQVLPGKELNVSLKRHRFPHIRGGDPMGLKIRLRITLCRMQGRQKNWH